MRREDVTALVEALETCLEMEERPKVIELARAALAAAQRPTEDGCHCATCTCDPNMTPAVRFDLSPAQQEGAIRDHLIRLGWIPPDEHALSQPAEQRAKVEALRAEVERLKSMTAVTMGVGSGGGNLFVHGDYESIKAAQAIVLERDALRAEVAEAREFRDKMANAIGNDQLRRFIEKHGEPVPLTIRMQAAESRADKMQAEMERVTCELMDAITRADKLAEALRELVDVFSESGMYDEEVFDKARAALAHGGEE